MADNASNNNTMCDTLKILHDKIGVKFNAFWAWLWCMPHTTHLPAQTVWILYILLSLLYFINCSVQSYWKVLVWSKHQTKKKKSLPRLVMAPLGQEFDDNIAGLEDKPENNSNDDTGEFKRFYLQLRR